MRRGREVSRALTLASVGSGANLPRLQAPAALQDSGPARHRDVCIRYEHALDAPGDRPLPLYTFNFGCFCPESSSSSTTLLGFIFHYREVHCVARLTGAAGPTCFGSFPSHRVAPRCLLRLSGERSSIVLFFNDLGSQLQGGDWRGCCFEKGATSLAYERLDAKRSFAPFVLRRPTCDNAPPYSQERR